MWCFSSLYRSDVSVLEPLNTRQCFLHLGSFRLQPGSSAYAFFASHSLIPALPDEYYCSINLRLEFDIESCTLTDLAASSI